MKLLVVVLACVVTSAWCQPEAVDLGAVSASADPVAPAGGLPLHLYTDFDLAFSPPNGAAQQSLVYVQNHREILIETLPDSPLMLEGDLLAPGNFFAVGFSLSLPFPFLEGSVLGSSVLKTGILLLPFGEFNYHHLYGGREDNQGRFLDRVWSDLGVQWTISPWEGSRVDIYSTNGIRAESMGPAWGPQQAGADSNIAKSLGLRWRQDLLPGWFISLSGYRDPYGTDQEPNKVAQMAGADAAGRWKALSARLGGAWGLVQGTGADFQRAAWYFEGKWDFDPSWALRVRGGTMAIDSRNLSSYANRSDINGALIWKTGPVEWNADVFLDAPTTEGFLGPSSTWEFLLKILYTI